MLTLVRLRTAEVQNQSLKIVATFLKNWGFGAILLSCANTYIQQKYRLTFRLSYLRLMPKYYMASLKSYREQLGVFFDEKIQEIRDKLSKEVERRRYVYKTPLEDHSIPYLKEKWIEAMVLNRKHGHFNLVTFFLQSKAYFEQKNPPR